jgi:putative membrane protein
MIRNFSDHAANERTFLAWIRTAIAIMAFGFLVEKFNLFLRIARASLGVRVAGAGGVRFGEAAGLALMVMGLALIAVTAARFLKASREIENATASRGPGSRLDITLAALLFLVGCALLIYLIISLVQGG